MKKTPLILSICALVVAAASIVLNFVPVKPAAAEQEASESEAPSASIAYFNLDAVVSAYDMSTDLQAAFEKKAKSIDEDLTRRRTKLENEDKELADKLNKGLVTRSTAEVQYNKLQEKVQSYGQLAQQKQNELAEEQQVMLNNIANAVNEYVKAYNEEKGYAMIIATQGSLLSQPVVTADATLDITEALIAGLNAEYQANKANKKK